MLIPKSFTFIWLGSPVPEADMAIINAWRESHPGWLTQVYTDENLSDMICAPTIRAIRENVPPQRATAAISDLVRTEILATYGGVYLDTDVVPIVHQDMPHRNLEVLLEHAELAVADEFPAVVKGELRPPFMGNFFMACTPGHPMMWRLNREIIARVEAAAFQSQTIYPVSHTGPEVVQHVFSRSADCTIFPYGTLSPWNGAFKCEDWKAVQWPKSAYGAHLFHTRWTSRRQLIAKNPQQALEPVWTSAGRSIA